MMALQQQLWKYWKTDNAKAAKMKVADLTEEDKLELFYEWIDGLHFLYELRHFNWHDFKGYSQPLHG